MANINVNQTNASETAKGIVEEATQAELNAGTDTGATGAKLFAVPSKILSLLGSYLTTASAAATYQTIAGLFASVMGLVLTGYAAGANVAVAATDTLAQALAKFQGQINASNTAIALRELLSNKSTDVVTDQASDSKYPSVKAVFDWATAQFATIVNLAQKAPLDSPTFTGTPAAPTAAGGTNTTQLATTEFVQSALNTPLVYSATASNSPTIDIPLSATYNSYVLVVTNLIPQTDATTLNFRTSTNGGSSFDSTAGDYRHARFLIIDTPATATAGSTSATEIPIAANLGTGAGENFSGTFKFFNPGAALAFCMDFDITYLTAAPVYIKTSGGGTRVAAANVDYVRFYMNSGNIASGEFRLYGLKNS